MASWWCTYVAGIHVARQLHYIHNFLCRCLEPVLADFFHVAGELVCVYLVNSTVVQADNCRVQVEIGVDSRWMAQIPREAEPFREEHEGAGQGCVELAVSSPKPAMFHVFWPVRLLSVDMPQDFNKQVAHYDSPCKCRVTRTAEDVGQSA